MRYSWLLVAVMFCAALPAQVSDSNPFATNAKFSFDDDDANVPKEVHIAGYLYPARLQSSARPADP
jgi:hypothetical protein